MDTRVALIGIIVEDAAATEEMNAILHDFSDYIIGRMGVPYRKRNINIISIALDASEDVISSLAGKLGRIAGLTVKTAYSSCIYKCDM